VRLRRPLVSGAAVRFDGQLATFDRRAADAACYACVFPESGDAQDEPCSTMGVFAPLTGIVGCIQAAEALKLAAGCDASLAGQLMIIDALSMQWHTLKVGRDPDCAVCAGA
jgi:adenylyltransferase/sulfurtransferase